jgi:hypothetical protein
MTSCAQNVLQEMVLIKISTKYVKLNVDYYLKKMKIFFMMMVYHLMF